MTTTSVRRPNPGYRVAPPVTDAYTPWVSALDADLAAGHYEWTMVDGTLVPMPLAEDEVRIRPKRRWWSRPTQ